LLSGPIKNPFCERQTIDCVCFHEVPSISELGGFRLHVADKNSPLPAASNKTAARFQNNPWLNPQYPQSEGPRNTIRLSNCSRLFLGAL
jgi:hypothetical protein